MHTHKKSLLKKKNLFGHVKGSKGKEKKIAVWAQQKMTEERIGEFEDWAI